MSGMELHSFHTGASLQNSKLSLAVLAVIAIALQQLYVIALAKSTTEEIIIKSDNRYAEDFVSGRSSVLRGVDVSLQHPYGDREGVDVSWQNLYREHEPAYGQYLGKDLGFGLPLDTFDLSAKKKSSFLRSSAFRADGSNGGDNPEKKCNRKGARQSSLLSSKGRCRLADQQARPANIKSQSGQNKSNFDRRETKN